MTDIAEASRARQALTTVAVISDVHSNLEALQAVLPHVRGMELYCLGDLVGYGASPNEVVETLREKGAVAVMGNHDYAAVTADTANFNARAAMALKWTTRELTGNNLEYLRALPRELRFRLGSAPGFLTHGSPDDNLWEYVDPSTHSQLFGHYLDRLDVQLLGLGHTHVPYVWKEGERTVFNPGSVGQPRDGDERASYALVSAEGSEVRVDVHRLDYDYEEAENLDYALQIELSLRKVRAS